MQEIFKLKINYVIMFNETQNHQPIEGWFKNHTENQSGILKLDSNPSYINYIMKY